MKKLLTWILFISFLYLVVQFLITERQKKIENAFFETTRATVAQMKYYDMLDLWFLKTPYHELDSKTQASPESYIKNIKEQFIIAIQNYQLTNPWQLPIELDTEKLLSSMSVQEKVAQLFIFGFDGTILSPWEKSFLQTYQPGGVILMGKNISEELLWLIQDLQSTQQVLPLFVSIDQEGGQVKRIDEELPGQPYLSLESICDVYKSRAKALDNLWVNMNFGIVADITEDTGSFIFPRVFQGEVSAKVEQAVACTHRTLSTLKHFPGHGWTALDTHQGIARLTKTQTEREEADLQPFLSWIWAESDLIMMGHLIADFLDPNNPATLSRPTNDFLREQWFDWLVVTDDMLMIRSNGNQLTQLEWALTAGNDLLLYVWAENKSEILDHAIEFVKDGWITEEDLNQRLRRILEKKQKIIGMDDFVKLELIR